jgi:hypothetical protein
MTIRAVLFDKDGTLIDVNATWIPIYREMLMDIFGTDLAGAEALMAKAGYDKASDKFQAHQKWTRAMHRLGVTVPRAVPFGTASVHGYIRGGSLRFGPSSGLCCVSKPRSLWRWHR